MLSKNCLQTSIGERTVRVASGSRGVTDTLVPVVPDRVLGQAVEDLPLVG